MAASRSAHFREADLKRALVAAQKSGIPNYRVEIELDGRIVVIVGNAAAKPARRNSWDDVLES